MTTFLADWITALTSRGTGVPTGQPISKYTAFAHGFSFEVFVLVTRRLGNERTAKQPSSLNPLKHSVLNEYISLYPK